MKAELKAQTDPTEEIPKRKARAPYRRPRRPKMERRKVREDIDAAIQEKISRGATLTDDEILATLSNWNRLHAVLKQLDEEHLFRALALERATECRLPMMIRIHTRASRIRHKREQRDLLLGIHK